MKRVKEILGNLAKCTVMVLYILATMGFGMHECDRDCHKSLILFFGETPCEYVHSHVDSEGHIHTHKHCARPSHTHVHNADGSVTENECCHTTAFVLSHEQDVQSSPQSSVPHVSHTIAWGVAPSTYDTSKIVPLQCRSGVPLPQSVSLSMISRFLI